MREALHDILSVTLVGAEYPVNVGYVARLLKNFGVRRLYLVDPKVDMRAASVYASHGASVLESAQMATLAEVRKAHDFLLGTTAIRARKSSNIGRTSVRPEEAVKRIWTSKSASIVLGRDTTGLMNEELAACDLVTTVETGTEYRTLNISHSVAILLYLTANARVQRALPERPASRMKREAFSRYSYRLAVASGIQGHRAERVVQVARRVALKSDASSKELGLLVSLMRKAEMKISRRVRPSRRRRQPS